MDFSGLLVAWYVKNKRDLPWRNTKEAYKIWLSEIILQQTRVNQGMPYYYAFTEHFPSVYELAKADIDEVYKLWQGLGYYSRAKNLHACAQKIVSDYGGVFPSKKTELLSLNGIGDYTASAISSFAFEKENPVVDGNVYRVLSRYFGIYTCVPSQKAYKQFYDIAFELMQEHKPSLFNQAIMEFGALQCTPKPDCSECVFRENCFAYTNNLIDKLPVKKGKTASANRYFYYFLIKTSNNKILIEKRKAKDIWQNLFQFPLVESNMALDEKEWGIKSSEFMSKFATEYLFTDFNLHKKHVLSHQNIHASFYGVKLFEYANMHDKQYIEIDIHDIGNFAFPRLITKNGEFLKNSIIQF